ncbi:MAG: SRPBCC family protein [Hyphomicrobium sp.]|jgi:hypothetical protein|nr:SRPBCC family protein [Hyphomicrobium sp.]
MKQLALVALATAVSATSASALEAHYSKQTTATPDKAWAAVGNDFCGISTWHPAVEKCELTNKDGKTERMLHLKGGGTIHEQLVSHDDKARSMTYIILDGVLPVSNYKSTLKVVADDKGATYDWAGTFDAKKGSTDDESVKAISGVYAAGVDALVEKSTK